MTRRTTPVSASDAAAASRKNPTRRYMDLDLREAEFVLSLLASAGFYMLPEQDDRRRLSNAIYNRLINIVRELQQ